MACARWFPAIIRGMRAASTWPILFAVGILLAVACTQATPTSTPTSTTDAATPTPTDSSDDTPTPTATPTPTDTATPVPAATPPGTGDDGGPTPTATATPEATVTATPPAVDPDNPFATASLALEQCAGLGDVRFDELRRGVIEPTESDLDRLETCRPEVARAELCSSSTIQDLADMDFKDEDLQGIDLSCANLQNANFEGANLRGANLAAADLSGASLRMAYLNEADLSYANLQFTDLFGADIRDANIEGTLWNFGTTCGDGGYPWRPGATDPQPEDMECPGSRPFGPPASLPAEYPFATMLLDGVTNRGVDVAPVTTSALWDLCPRLITDVEATPFTLACVKAATDAGMVYLSYHPFGWVEHGSSGWEGIMAAYPDLPTEGLRMDYAGDINPRGGGAGGGDAIPTSSNASDAWLEVGMALSKRRWTQG